MILQNYQQIICVLDFLRNQTIKIFEFYKRQIILNNKKNLKSGKFHSLFNL